MDSSTTNSYGWIVAGSRVQIAGSNQIYDVGEINERYATLYLKNKRVGTYPIGELIPV